MTQSVSVLTSFTAELHEQHTGVTGVVTGERWLQAIAATLVTVPTAFFTNQIICDSPIVTFIHTSNYMISEHLAMQCI